MPGLLVSIEGPDGAGKSTLARLLADDLSSKYTVVRVREPGGTEISEQIRQIILNPAHAKMSCRTEAMLYVAARAQVIEEVINPALDRNQVVICDRFIDSTIAYQGFGRGLPIRELSLLNEVATGGILPDLTILLDMDVDAALHRTKYSRKPDRMEKENTEFHRRVRNGFLTLAQDSPERIKVLEASRPISEVFAEARLILESFL